MVRYVVPQRLWESSPTALGTFPKGVGVPSQRPWDTFPTALGTHASNVNVLSCQASYIKWLSILFLAFWGANQTKWMV